MPRWVISNHSQQTIYLTSSPTPHLFQPAWSLYRCRETIESEPRQSARTRRHTKLAIKRDLTQLGRERRRRRLLKFELPVFPFLICIAHSFLLKFCLKLCEHRKLETLILKLHGDWNDSCFVVHVLWELQNWAFQVLFTKEDEGKVARWLHSHVKSLYFVINSIVLWRSRRRSRPSFVRSQFRENADLLSIPVRDILNLSYIEYCLPQSWKEANVVPVTKQKPVKNVKKHLRPISLTPVISKIAEEFIVEEFVKPAVMAVIDDNQFGTVPKSSTTQALISMIHAWSNHTDGNGSTVRVVLFDFRKAFDLIDHCILARKLENLDLPPRIVSWITDFLKDRKQRVKLSRECFSEWGTVPAWVPQGTRLGPGLLLVMINNLNLGHLNLWKFVDDMTTAEPIPNNGVSKIQDSVDDLVNKSSATRFQLNVPK